MSASRVMRLPRTPPSPLSVCTSHLRARRPFGTSCSQRFEDIRSESRMPRIATKSLWAALVPKFLRRSARSDESGAALAATSRAWNPYTTFIILAVLVGSNAIQLIALRNDMLNFSRKTDAKLELLREVVQRVKNGEDVDVRRLLGTGVASEEREWEEVVRELEETDTLWQDKNKKEAKMEERRGARETEHAATGQGREDQDVAGAPGAVEPAERRRSKFMM